MRIKKYLNYLNRLNSIQKYQLSFFLTAIFPTLIFTILFLNDTQTKLNRSVENQVKPGVILVKDAIQDNYNELRISSQQEVRYLKKNVKIFDDEQALIKNLSQYKKAAHADIVIFLLPDGRVIDANANLTPQEKIFIKSYIIKSIEEQHLFGIKSFKSQGQKYLSTFYLTSVSLPNKTSNGVLLVGDYLKNNQHFNTLSMLDPKYSIRIVEKKHKKISKKISKNIINSPSINNPNQIKPRIIFEKINDTPYVSAILGLQNNHSEIIGQIIFSLPYEQDLLKYNLILIFFTSLFILVFVILIGKWFESDFILPMNQLTMAFKDVSNGNFKNKLNCRSKRLGKEAMDSFNSFNTMLDNLEDNKNLKNNLISTLTHDLRTPLLAQERVAEILKNEYNSIEEKKRNQLLEGLIINNCNLLEMVNSMLEAYEYENGAITLNQKTLSLEGLINECFSELEPLIKHNKITTEVLLEPHSIKVFADKKALKRVFINLLGNAIQNVPKGSQIKIKAAELNNLSVINIIDNGPGISEGIISHVFERYFSANTLQKKIGSGLGLYICKTIIEMHKGKITVDSKLGAGTTFTIYLPIKVEK